MPKIELHHHLDGSVRPATILDIAKKHNIYINQDKLFIKGKMTSLQEVLDCFDTNQRIFLSYEAIKRIAFENVEDAFYDGVKLVELRFAPAFMSAFSKIKNDEIIEGILDGISDGMDKYKIQVGLIGILARAQPITQNELVLNDLIKYSKKYYRNADRICAIDLADSEEEYNMQDYLNLIEKAKNADLKLTVHSGENTNAEYVQKTLEVFSPTRIGHGIKAADRIEVMDMLKEKDIHLEICPTSNFLTNSVPSLEEHPIRKLFDYGVSLSISSDDPNIMNINLIHEYEIAVKYFKFTYSELKRMNEMALKHSFLPDDIKKDICL